MNSIDWLIQELADNGFLNMTCSKYEAEAKRKIFWEIVENAKKLQEIIK